jgi:hypothetical protein
MSDTPPEAPLELRIQHKLRSAFLTVFQGTGDYGALVLSAIGNECGVNETDPEKIRPDLIALWNWLLSMLGIRGEVNMNLTSAKAYQDYIAEAKVILSIANMNDVTEEMTPNGGTDGKAGA